VGDGNIQTQLLTYASPNLKRCLRFCGTMGSIIAYEAHLIVRIPFDNA
jgi:hypothetical protein